jgi:hypothetical protein
MSDAERKPFWGKCGECDHVWIVGYFPLEANKFAKLLKRAACPSCAASGNKVFVASQSDGKLNEPIAECAG